MQDVGGAELPYLYYEGEKAIRKFFLLMPQVFCPGSGIR